VTEPAYSSIEAFITARTAPCPVHGEVEKDTIWSTAGLVWVCPRCEDDFWIADHTTSILIEALRQADTRRGVVFLHNAWTHLRLPRMTVL